MHQKIKLKDEISELLENEKKKGKSVVQCHGVFDLLHPGHIKHFEEAKNQGDILVVSVTADQFVNKGPGRPAFSQQLRLESLASLSVVDYVTLSEESTAVGAIYSIKPNIYVKGKEYKDEKNDLTGKISEEALAVEKLGGKIYFTDDITFSSSYLINEYIESKTPELKEYISKFKSSYSLEDLLNTVDDFKNLKVTIIGDAIIDIYQYVSPLGQSGKGLHMSTVCNAQDVYLGGSLIIANHIADFVKEVNLVTSIGSQCPYQNFIDENLLPNVKKYFVNSILDQTLIKKRYVIRDGNQLNKLFETYSSNEPLLKDSNKKTFSETMQECIDNSDLVIVCDFGNGLIDEDLASIISKTNKFLAVNTQTNSGNRGYNVITKYARADYISLNEPELRLAAHDKTSPINKLVQKIKGKVSFSRISVTGGVTGISAFENDDEPIKTPALSFNAIDRVGAGDSFLALSSLCLAIGANLEIANFIGSLAAAMNIQIIGNKEAIRKIPLCKYMTRLLK